MAPNGNCLTLKPRNHVANLHPPQSCIYLPQFSWKHSQLWGCYYKSFRMFVNPVITRPKNGTHRSWWNLSSLAARMGFVTTRPYVGFNHISQCLFLTPPETITGGKLVRHSLHRHVYNWGLWCVATVDHINSGRGFWLWYWRAYLVTNKSVP